MSKPLRTLLLIVVVAGLVLIEWRPWQGSPKHSVSEEPVGSDADKTTSITNTSVEPSAETKRPVGQAGLSDAPLTSNTIQVIRAQLSPVQFTTITAEISAKVESLRFREGEPFNQGDALVTFDCSVQLAQLEKVKATMGITERNYNTNKKLLALGSVSKIETENAYSEYLKSKAEVSELSAVVSKCKIAAPFNGRVVEQKVRVQQFVQSGQALLDILDSSVLELEFVAPSKWSTWIKPGYLFKIKIDEAGKSYPARVTRISPRIDPVSQTIKIAAIIDGTFSELTPGMSGSIEIDPPEASR